MKKLVLAVLFLAGSTRASVTSTASSSGPYTCDGSQTVYTVGFRFLADSDLQVVVAAPAPYIGSVTLTLNSDYTVAGAGGASGIITLAAGSKCQFGYGLTVSRTVPLTQPTSFLTQGTFSPKVHENAFDRVVMQVQQIDRNRSAVIAAQATRDSNQDAAITAIGSGVSVPSYNLVNQATGGSVTLAPPNQTGTYTFRFPIGLPLFPPIALPLNITSAGVTSAAYVTRPQMAAVGQQVSASSGSFNLNTATYTNVDNLSVTITTTGRPVLVSLMPDGTGANAYIGLVSPGTTGHAAHFQLMRGSTRISGVTLNTDIVQTLMSPPGSITMLDVVGAGTYTYTLQIQGIGSGGTAVSVYNCVLVAWEL
jgi:hypothetical protein